MGGIRVRGLAVRALCVAVAGASGLGVGVNGAAAAEASSAAGRPAVAPAAAGTKPTIAAAWVGPAAVEKGRRITLAGRVAGSPAGTGSVRLERRIGGVWTPLTTIAVRADRTWSSRIVVPALASAQNYRVIWTVAGKPLATGVLPVLDVYRVNTYVVATRGAIVADVDTFAAQAAATYADPRGWTRAHQRFQRVRSGGDFTLVLAQAATMPSFSSDCSAQYSCRVGRQVVVNQTPWLKATPAFGGDLRTYRHMVVNHETGHWLGLGHQSCQGTGLRAPVMMQQSKGLKGCRSNAWPLAAELPRVARR